MEDVIQDGGASTSEGESYRLNPHFRRLMEIVKPVGLAAVAWQIAKEAFAPSNPDGYAEYEVWQDDAMVAGCSGPRRQSLAEAVHYAVVYQTDESPCVIQEVTRREITPDDASFILASDLPTPDHPDAG